MHVKVSCWQQLHTFLDMGRQALLSACVRGEMLLLCRGRNNCRAANQVACFLRALFACATMQRLLLGWQHAGIGAVVLTAAVADVQPSMLQMCSPPCCRCAALHVADVQPSMAWLFAAVALCRGGVLPGMIVQPEKGGSFTTQLCVAGKPV
jgi:hypothetical protein